MAPGGRGELAARLGIAADDRRDLDESQAEDIVQDQGDPLAGAELLHDHEQGDRHRLLLGYGIGRVAGRLDTRGAQQRIDPAGQGLRQPDASVLFPPCSRRPQLVEAEPADDAGQPGERLPDQGTVTIRKLLPADLPFLDRVLGILRRAKQTVGDPEQVLVLGIAGHEGHRESFGSWVARVEGPAKPSMALGRRRSFRITVTV